ncbi:MmgE/PrpD family protein [Pararobbsia silviterrae]|uniref:MmgE/PrpD family protein n=1 Tax=Pararobbsia silviterrae TaxID=1792498 RepID=A0A494YEZ2_9BURK|nr:MmgE/PrpD family protein [Pararobbsia silviterrae]RKP59288.1 MmgE/PrpD family protein [Pararobbsia silviterrae]
MSATTENASPDRLLGALATYVVQAPGTLDAAASRAARLAIADTVAVALGALPHRPAQLARRYARHYAVPTGATLWGTGQRVLPETAALVNGVPLRGFDYNDIYASVSGGHPSDMIPGLIALAEWFDLSGRRVLDALAVGYEIAVDLFDTFAIKQHGWDYPTLTAIAAACAVARLLRLDEAETRASLAIALTSHFASDEAESNELNTRGDLTMWKRFNGSNATRQAIFAALLAREGVEGVVRPFEGRCGLLAKVPTGDAALATLFERLTPGHALQRVSAVSFKRWPVGSRGQSAIQAALQARAAIGDIARVAQVRISTDRSVFEHLVTKRSDPWHPDSRETADHSLPYIVATALLDGYVHVSSFDVAKVRDPERQRFLNERLSVEVSEALSVGAQGGFPTRVELFDTDGRRFVGEAKAPPGHPLQPFSDADMETKFLENVAPLFGGAAAREIFDTIRSFEDLTHVRDLTSRLVVADTSKIDSDEATIA